jgi:hypothetical protein
MTMLMLYAVVPAGAPVETPEALARLDLGSVGVLYQERDRPPSAEQADLLSFGEVVQDLASTSPVLPVRFGTTLPDLAGLEQLMEERGPGWRRRLDAVEGHVEMVVHARDAGRPAPTEPSASGEVTGTEYLLSRAAVARHDAELIDSLNTTIGPLVAETRVLRGHDESRVACLVAADRVAALRAALQGWAAAVEGRSAEATGPWPPFSFTEPEETP